MSPFPLLWFLLLCCSSVHLAAMACLLLVTDMQFKTTRATLITSLLALLFPIFKQTIRNQHCSVSHNKLKLQGAIQPDYLNLVGSIKNNWGIRKSRYFSMQLVIPGKLWISDILHTYNAILPHNPKIYYRIYSSSTIQWDR